MPRAARPPAGRRTASPARRCRTKAGTPPPFPAQPSAWVALSERFGRLPFADLFEPAIRYARDGFLVSPTIAMIWGNQVERLQRPAGLRRNVSAAWPRAERGRAFSRAEPREDASGDRRDGAARASIAARSPQRSREASASAGGFMTADDLAAHDCDWIAADRCRVSRPSHPRAAAERPGHRGADRARHPRPARPRRPCSRQRRRCCICRSRR